MRSRGGKVRVKTPVQTLRAKGVLLDERLAVQAFDPAALFGRPGLLEIEVGPGKGAFLLTRAGQRSDINLLALEWLSSYAAYLADRVWRLRLTNVRVLCADAAVVFRVSLPDACAWRIHIHYPDPWPKHRHRHRRLITPRFLREASRVLQPGGSLLIATDHRAYHLQIARIARRTPGLASVQCAETSIPTNFAQRYSASCPAYAVAGIKYVPRGAR